MTKFKLIAAAGVRGNNGFDLCLLETPARLHLCPASNETEPEILRLSSQVIVSLLVVYLKFLDDAGEGQVGLAALLQ